MSVVITTYTLASGLMQQGMTWWQALATILLGNAIVLVPMILNAHAGTKYGVSFPVLCRAAFGVKGANVPAGPALGLPLTMTAFAFLGVAVTSATIVICGEAVWDPVVLIARIGSPAVVIFGALVILAAQITTNMAANVVSPANDFSSLAPKRISYVTGGLITACLGIVMMPWKLYADASAYIFTWLIGYSSLMGAVGGVLIADYWILRKRELSLPDLFKIDGRYSYGGGINGAALVALICAILPVIPGFARAATTPGGVVADPTLFDHIYTYAWFVTFGLSAAIYLALMRRNRRASFG